MKRIFLFSCVAIATIMTTNGFAFELNKGKIIQHKEWSTGSVNTLFHEAKKPLLKLAAGQFSATYSKLDVAYGTVGIPTTLTGSSSAFVSNATDDIQVFTFLSGICTVSSEQNDECSYSYDIVELQPGGSFVQQIEPAMSLTFTQPGHYDVVLATRITGYGYTSSTTSSKAIIVLGKK